MRILIVGDFHLKEDDLQITRQAMEDAAGCGADLVVPLGDFGSNEKIGRVEGLAQSYDYLSSIKAPLRPILGNHDLERESGRVMAEQGVIQQEFIRLFGLDKPYGVLEYDAYRLMFVSTDPQPADSCYQVQECYVSQEQYDWFLNCLSERPGTPVIMFTHAPPIGCGLRTVPEVHVRATNAYLDQNHDPYRWLRLFQTRPEIVMWFSAHYHLSHMYEDSQTNQYGTAFFTTGVHGRATRDKRRQSRMLDISGSKISVSTLDHDQRNIIAKPDWIFNGSIEQLMNTKINMLQSFGKTGPAESSPEEQLPTVRMSGSCAVGKKSVLPWGIVPFKKNHFLIATQDGYLWELDAEANAVLGTYHVGETLSCFAYSEGTVWRAWGTYLVPSFIATPGRFVHKQPEGAPAGAIHMPFPPQTIAPRTGGGVWISAANAVFKLESDFNQAAANLLTVPVLTLHEDIIQMKTSGSRLWLHTVNGNLYKWDCIEAAAELMAENVVSWDCDEHQLVVILHDHKITVLGVDRTHNFSESIDISSFKSNESEIHSAQLLCLENRNMILVIAGKAMLWDNCDNKWLLLDTNGKRVIAAARHYNESAFCLGVDTIKATDVPQMQMWKY